MRRIVSVSLGESRRDASAEINLLGERIRLERRGVDGDLGAMAALLRELDGQVDALGIGGADLGLRVAGRWYPLYEIARAAQVVKRTPVVDGTGLKCTLERRAAAVVDRLATPTERRATDPAGSVEMPIARRATDPAGSVEMPIARRATDPAGSVEMPIARRVLFTAGADRWGLTEGFLERGYETVFGDLMFGLGLPFPLRSAAAVIRVAAIAMPIVGRLPFRWVYPIGAAQSEWRPRFERWYDWAGVIAGDCHYIKRHRPARLDGKVICTNTTTPADVALFREAGAAWLVTTTPRLGGRTFGTNVFEAALIAARGLGRALTDAELDEAIDQLGLKPEALDLSEEAHANPG